MTVREALDNMSIFLGSQGMDPESDQALFYLNRARRLVYPLDDWTHTIKYGCLNLMKGCFLLPEDCSAVRAAWIGKKSIQIHNEYFDAVDQDFVVRNHECETKFFRTGRTLPATFIPDCNQLYFQADNGDDAGKAVYITYKDVSGNIEIDKLELKDDFQLTETASQVKEIKSLGKSRTKGTVSIINASGQVLYSMAPHFTSGRFEEYKIDGQETCCPVLVKCKLRFRDYTKDDLDELIDIESIDGLEFAANAMYAKSQSDIAGYQANILLARTHLEIAKENLETSSKGYEAIRMPKSNPTDEYFNYNR